MKRLLMLCLLGAAVAQMPLVVSTAFAADQLVQAKEGSMLYSEDGRRLGAVYKVSDDGSVKVIYNNKMVVIPASTLTDVKGKLTTTLTKSEVYGLTQQSAD